MPILNNVYQVTADFVSFHFPLLRSQGFMAAETFSYGNNSSSTKSEREPRRIDPSSRLGLVLLSRLFNWKEALVIVRPNALMA